MMDPKDRRVLYLFTTPRCSACKRMEPIAVRVCSELGIPFYAANAQTATELAMRYAIQSVPTLVLVVNGAMLRATTRVMRTAELREWIEGDN